MRTVLGLLIVSALAGCAVDGSSEAELAGSDAPNGGKADLIEVENELSSPLAILENPQVIFHGAPGLAAVQPTASLKFSYASCAARTWDVKRQTTQTLQGDRVLIQVEDARGLDCFGPTISREYDVQISSDAFQDTSFVLLNPSVLTYASPTRECAPVACDLYCENGFKTGADGCEICQCAEPPPPPSSCPPVLCALFCENGFARGEDGCEVCRCAE